MKCESTDFFLESISHVIKSCMKVHFEGEYWRTFISKRNNSMAHRPFIPVQCSIIKKERQKYFLLKKWFLADEQWAMGTESNYQISISDCTIGFIPSPKLFKSHIQLFSNTFLVVISTSSCLSDDRSLMDEPMWHCTLFCCAHWIKVKISKTNVFVRALVVESLILRRLAQASALRISIDVRLLHRSTQSQRRTEALGDDINWGNVQGGLYLWIFHAVSFEKLHRMWHSECCDSAILV
jgi:hypothetical protein